MNLPCSELMHSLFPHLPCRFIGALGVLTIDAYVLRAGWILNIRASCNVLGVVWFESKIWLSERRYDLSVILCEIGYSFGVGGELGQCWCLVVRCIGCVGV